MVPTAPALATATVPRQYVHKASHAEVLLTGRHSRSSDAHMVTAQWPRTHSFYAPTHGLHDPLLFAETVRQVIPLLSHTCYDVPFGHHLIWDNFRYEVVPGAMAVGGTPAELLMDIQGVDVVRRRGCMSAMTLNVATRREGVVLGTAVARFTAHAPAVYRRLRGARADMGAADAVPLSEPVPPAQVGRDRTGDVVLSATDREDQWLLRVDTGHPILFDHPVDHVPGMLLLEAARQAANAIAHPSAVLAAGMSTKFHRYVELDAPCFIEARVSLDCVPDRVCVHVAARQHGEVCLSTTVQLATEW
ncbi:ScbA/BarX family gamma-butyrolactone biosynthesis protein [Streptomyces niger]|uniref:ScbA/BarX family gamma-butyrolactone biosynthesis protein n=1 Tax=Streptomyces niger TaxID=66373 RepID=UPI00069C4A13|nr:ScbA/BarX family gamma-butyrolactone biosynthesis protein [Streptomyces niger]